MFLFILQKDGILSKGVGLKLFEEWAKVKNQVLNCDGILVGVQVLT